MTSPRKSAKKARRYVLGKGRLYLNDHDTAARLECEHGNGNGYCKLFAGKSEYRKVRLIAEVIE